MLAHDLDSPIHRISVEQFHRMIEAGCFGDGALDIKLAGVRVTLPITSLFAE